MIVRIITLIVVLIVASAAIAICASSDSTEEGYHQYVPRYVSAITYNNPIDDQYSSWHVIGRAEPIYIVNKSSPKSYVLQQNYSRGLNKPSTIAGFYKYRVIAPTGEIIDLMSPPANQQFKQGQYVRTSLGSLKNNVIYFRVDLNPPSEQYPHFYPNQPAKFRYNMYNNYVKFTEHYTPNQIKESYTCDENNPNNILLNPVVIRGNRFRYNKAEQAQRLRHVFGTEYKTVNTSQRSTLGPYGTGTNPFQ